MDEGEGGEGGERGISLVVNIEIDRKVVIFVDPHVPHNANLHSQLSSLLVQIKIYRLTRP